MSFRDKLISFVPDVLNWCNKYEGKPHPFRGKNNPLWVIYKYIFEPQNLCLYKVDKGIKCGEICICCEHVWVALVCMIPFMSYGALIAWLFMNYSIGFTIYITIVTPIFLILFIYGILLITQEDESDDTNKHKP